MMSHFFNQSGILSSGYSGRLVACGEMRISTATPFCSKSATVFVSSPSVFSIAFPLLDDRLICFFISPHPHAFRNETADCGYILFPYAHRLAYQLLLAVGLLESTKIYVQKRLFEWVESFGSPFFGVIADPLWIVWTTWTTWTTPLAPNVVPLLQPHQGKYTYTDGQYHYPFWNTHRSTHCIAPLRWEKVISTLIKRMQQFHLLLRRHVGRNVWAIPD